MPTFHQMNSSDVMELSKNNCKSSLSWGGVCTWTNYEWELLWRCWGLLCSWM